MFDFRAHGLSGGERDALGTQATRDVAGALVYLAGRGLTQVGVYGVSLGGAAGLLAAAQHPGIRAVLAEAPYAELEPLITADLPRRTGLPPVFNPGILLMGRLAYGIDFAAARPVAAMPNLGDCAVLLVHSTQDQIVPVSATWQLQQAAGDYRYVSAWIMPTGRHGEGFAADKEEYTRRMLTFFDHYVPGVFHWPGIAHGPTGVAAR
jgi:alpha-beta hydrolase superfamily lysophospholipase